jgi:hemoglobin
MKESVITDESITRLVHDFYSKVRADKYLGSIFAAAIGDDDSKWEPHLQRMVDFWSSIMLTSGCYHGNPFQKHKDLPPFDISLFDRWLELFAETAGELYNQENADRFIEKSRRIAESLKLGLYYKPARTEQ